jgi:UDP-N-acetylglucosamine 2-epimerase (non-hydrolysing)
VTRVAVVLGTRPEAIKLAPLVVKLHETTDFTPVVISTGQHRAMLDQVLDVFGLEADLDLNLCRPGQSLTQLSAAAMVGLDDAMARIEPDVVIVQGDTTTTLSGALTAFQRRIPLVHVEAGLRSGDVDSPFPEEANRRLVTPLAALHLAATESNGATLYAEGVAERDVVVTGNTVIDALYSVLHRSPEFATPGLATALNSSRPIVTVTAHRRESWGPALAEIAAAVGDLADRHDLQVVWPMHANPAVAATVRSVLTGRTDVALVEPLPYTDFVQLLARSAVVLSDSGGVQEECPALGVPVAVLRDVTERREAVEAGAAIIAGTQRRRIVDVVSSLLRRPSSVGVVSPYGDGLAAERAVDALRYRFLGRRRPDPFVPQLAARWDIVPELAGVG